MNPDVLKRLFPNASTSCRALNGFVSDTKPQPNKGRALEPELPKPKEGIRRFTVRFVGCRVRPLDPDNFAGSIKDLLDGLRHADLISGDEFWRIKLETEQEKVSHYRDEKTVIEIYQLP